MIFRSDIPPFPCLAEGEVHLWRACCTGREPGDWEKLLDPDESARAERWKFPEHRHRFVVFRGITRTILGLYLRQPPAAVPILCDASGKPRLASSAADLRFNLSHSGDWMALAVTAGAEVGIDMERLDSRLQMSAIARRHFDTGEYQLVEAADDVTRPAVFMRAWTAREAVLKAEGTGLGQLDAVGTLMPRWQIIPFTPVEGWLGSVAITPGSRIAGAWHFPVS